MQFKAGVTLQFIFFLSMKATGQAAEKKLILTFSESQIREYVKSQRESIHF